MSFSEFLYLKKTIDFLEFGARLDITNEAREVNCPVLLIHSERDRMVPVEDGKYLSTLLPDCRFKLMSGDNHTMVPGTPGFKQGMQEIENFLR